MIVTNKLIVLEFSLLLDMRQKDENTIYIKNVFKSVNDIEKYKSIFE